MAIETNELIDVKTLSPFKKFIMTIGNIPTSYLESMSYAELLMWFCDYLQNTVIPTVNNNADAVEELQGLYIELKNYVDNYFDNLDVQTEINNKLDAMAEDGTLPQLIQQYIMPYFNAFTTQINNTVENQNNTISEIETKVNSVASGSPAGVYDTVSDLTTDDPDHDKIYVVTADGNWYYYDSSTTSWTSGGIYQSELISENDPVIEDIYAKINAISGRSRNLLDEEDITLTKSHTQAFISLADYNLSGDKTYTFSFTGKDVIESTSANNNLVIRYRMNSSTGTQVQFDTQTIHDGVYTFTFTPNSDLYNFSFVISSSVSNDTTITLTNFMLSEGDTYIPYIPYITADDEEARTEIELIKNQLDITYKVQTYAQLLDAINNGGIISLINDIELDSKVNISNKNLYIIGNGHTITGDSDITDNLITVGGSHVTLENVNLQGSNTIDYLLIIGSDSTVYINNCNFTYAHDSLIRIINNGIAYINNCDVGYSYTNDGISPAGTSNVYINNCKVHDCYDEGISSHNSSYCEVYNTEAYNNGYIVGTQNKGATSSFGGIHLGGGKMGIVKGCYSHNNCTYGIGLINFQDSTQIDIENCTDNIIKNNGGAGIFCTGARRLILGYNTIINNAEAIHFGLDQTYTPTIDLVASAGIVNKNTLYNNTNNNIIIDTGADDGIVIIN